MHWGLFITLGGYQHCIGDCSLHWEDIISALRVFSAFGDVASALGDVPICEAYRQCIGSVPQ